jgi:hypothetical protein
MTARMTIPDLSVLRRCWPEYADVSTTQVRVEGVEIGMESGFHGLLIEVLAPGADRSQLKCDEGQPIPPEIFGEIVTCAKE